jgi:hypothetical protein
MAHQIRNLQGLIETSAIGMGKRNASLVPQSAPSRQSPSANDSHRIPKTGNAHQEEIGSTTETKVQRIGNQPAGALPNAPCVRP